MGTTGLDPSLFKAVGTITFPWNGLSMRTTVKGIPRETIAIVKPIKKIEVPFKSMNSESLSGLEEVISGLSKGSSNC